MATLVRFASSPRDLEAAFALRRAVFEVEQGVPRPLDRDAFDDRASHVVAWDDAGRCVGTGRLVRLDRRTGVLGREAVPAELRRTGIGAALLDALERMAKLQGLRELTVNAQLPAEPFYRNRGYVREGEPFQDQGVPHVRMKKALAR
ncbi:GNAT family N-acetyltransferase [Anaeromyxobacter oryzisoli]|uniref:GNAT family N-acetyltransferase n=1 Tax=Anaeromyxobacter oryzisoli TaxID=2925408 RepID=UPI001F5849DD|nr:GNAT family N-acetyltransferase [Anaeromyxobacter sp. SG63]